MGGIMNKVKSIIMMVGAIVIFSGCATMKEKFPLDVDQTAQAFFDNLQK